MVNRDEMWWVEGTYPVLCFHKITPKTVTITNVTVLIYVVLYSSLSSRLYAKFNGKVVLDHNSSPFITLSQIFIFIHEWAMTNEWMNCHGRLISNLYIDAKIDYLKKNVRLSKNYWTIAQIMHFFRSWLPVKTGLKDNN